MTTPLRGVAAAPGVARARIWRLPERSSEDASSGSGMGLEEAAERAAAELESLQERLRSRGREEESEIFGAQAMMAQDPELLEAAQEAVDQGKPPEQAIRDAAESAATALAALDDELLAARAADVRDVAARIVRILRGEQPPRLEERSIAVALDLPPSITARLAIEAGVRQGWDRYVGPKGDVICLDRFGASAPGDVALKNLGFNIENVLTHARALR